MINYQSWPVKKSDGGVMFNSTEELIEDIRMGKMVILVDDEDRENEGDIVCAADFITPTMINFMASEARGLICLALAKDQVERLQLPLMVRDDENYTPNKTAFTVSIEASSGVSTGISAADRAHTIRVASHRNAKPSDIHTPGHVFPIKAQEGGVLKRAGHTEGSVDLARLAGHTPAAVICEVMNADGTMARVPDLRGFAEKHGLKIGTIVDLIEYRLANESLVTESVEPMNLVAPNSSLKIRIFRSNIDGAEHLVFQKGEIRSDQPTLVRVHVESAPKDTLSVLLNPESSLSLARKRILESQGPGVLVILRGEQKSNHPKSLENEVKMMMGLHERSVAMDGRDYGIGAQILRSLGVHKIKLLSRRPEKKVGLKAYGLEIVDVEAINMDHS
jgi:3,4-dihydroxy 2-butanone 4-phosphate synthase/GTP cyclohydrolase II